MLLGLSDAAVVGAFALVGTIVTVLGGIAVAILGRTHHETKKVASAVGEKNGHGSLQDQFDEFRDRLDRQEARQADDDEHRERGARRQMQIHESVLDMQSKMIDQTASISDLLERVAALQGWSERHEGVDMGEFGDLRAGLGTLRDSLDELNTYTHDFKHNMLNEVTKQALAAEVIAATTARLARIEAQLSNWFPEDPPGGVPS